MDTPFSNTAIKLLRIFFSLVSKDFLPPKVVYLTSSFQSILSLEFSKW